MKQARLKTNTTTLVFTIHGTEEYQDMSSRLLTAVPEMTDLLCDIMDAYEGAATPRLLKECSRIRELFTDLGLEPELTKGN